MDGNTLITRTGTLVEAALDNELFALDIECGQCFGFNATAAEIWQLLETPMTLAALCAQLATTHEIDDETCRDDTAALIHALAADKLVALTP